MEMSKAQHTQGPWKILPEECTKPYIRIRGTVFGGRYKVANVLSPSYEGINDREHEETVANARLIAAAPELLEALEELMPAITAQSDGIEHMATLEGRVKWYDKIAEKREKCRAAIAKAKGE